LQHDPWSRALAFQQLLIEQLLGPEVVLFLFLVAEAETQVIENDNFGCAFVLIDPFRIDVLEGLIPIVFEPQVPLHPPDPPLIVFLVSFFLAPDGAGVEAFIGLVAAPEGEGVVVILAARAEFAPDFGGFDFQDMEVSLLFDFLEL
jgi:hypothetical protein